MPDALRPASAASGPAYVEFAVMSNFSFLRGASHPDELVMQAALLGHRAIGIADVNSVAGVVRAHVAARDLAREAVERHGPGTPPPVRVHPGARLVFCDGGPDVLAYPVNRAGWARLCRLLTLGRRRAPKGECRLSADDLFADLPGTPADLALIVLPAALSLGCAVGSGSGRFASDTKHGAPLDEASPPAGHLPADPPGATDSAPFHPQPVASPAAIDPAPLPAPSPDPHPAALPAPAGDLPAPPAAIDPAPLPDWPPHPRPTAASAPTVDFPAPSAAIDSAAVHPHPSAAIDSAPVHPHPSAPSPPGPDGSLTGTSPAPPAVAARRQRHARSVAPIDPPSPGARGPDRFAAVPDPSTSAAPAPPGPAAAPSPDAPEADFLARLARAAPGRVWCAAAMPYRGEDRADLAARAALAMAAGVPLVAVNDVLMHAPARRPLADVVTCIREGLTLAAAGLRLSVHAERHLKPAAEMARLFRDAPQAVAATATLSQLLAFSLDDLAYDYPDEVREGFASPQDALIHFTWEGAARRYPAGVPDKVRRAVEHEFALIGSLGYAPYFLTVHDIVRFARTRGILAQGRGSAANSAVCFCLGITEVDPDRSDLLFERFVSAERREPPDIDVDFEHERREEVMQYIYARYGRARAGLTATVITYRARSALREVGKVFGLSADTLDRLSGSIWGWSSGSLRNEDLARLGLDPAAARTAQMLTLMRELVGFPRHLSQHTGGFVITRGRLDEVVPIENAAMEGRTVVEWDKDDLDALGILKIDILALGMLSCLSRAFDLLGAHYGRPLSVAAIPAEDPATYRMIQRADTLGVFQIESRAQMTMLPRLKPASFYDLVIEVAIVRPGPIQGDMVHPYLRRRQGREKVTFPSPAPEHGPPDELERVLGKTLGVPLFQEQAMKIAIVAAGFTPSEADRLRRAMATFRKVGTIGSFAAKMVEGMVARGYDRDFAERCFKQIEGFGEYGFPESHAASFALLVYASCWLKCHYPDVFAAALLNAQPLGFYAPAQIVRDAREHGVEMRPVDIGFSDWDATLERGPHAADRLHHLHRDMARDVWSSHAVRLGFREVKGLAEADARRVVEKRGGGYDSVRDVWLRTGLPVPVIARLADADAFRSLGLSRRQALWAAQALGRAGDKDDLPLFAALDRPSARHREPDVALPPLPPGGEVVADYRALSLSLKAHPLMFLRETLEAQGVAPTETLRTAPNGRRATIAGLVLVRQRPGSAKGVVFMTLEDETGIGNCVVWPAMFERFRPVVLGARLVIAHGRVQNDTGVVHLVVERLEDATALLGLLAAGEAPQALARADEVARPQDDARGARPTPLRRARMAALLAEMPELPRDVRGGPEGPAPPEPLIAADLDVPARATRHRPPRSGRPRAAHPPSLACSTPGEPGEAAEVMPKGRNFR